MRSHGVAVGEHSAHKHGIRLRALTDQEERRVDSEPCEFIEDSYREHGVRTVIEGQRNGTPVRVQILPDVRAANQRGGDTIPDACLHRARSSVRSQLTHEAYEIGELTLRERPSGPHE